VNLFYFLIQEGGMKPAKDREELDALLAGPTTTRRRSSASKLASLGAEVKRS